LGIQQYGYNILYRDFHRYYQHTYHEKLKDTSETLGKALNDQKDTLLTVNEEIQSLVTHGFETSALVKQGFIDTYKQINLLSTEAKKQGIQINEISQELEMVENANGLFTSKQLEGIRRVLSEYKNLLKEVGGSGASMPEVANTLIIRTAQELDALMPRVKELETMTEKIDKLIGEPVCLGNTTTGTRK
jgi:hypothetical protein